MKIDQVLKVGDFFSSPNGESFEVIRQIAAGGFGQTFIVTGQSSGAEYVAKAPVMIEEVRIKAIEIEFRVLRDLENRGVEKVMRPVFITHFDSPNGRFPILVVETARGTTLEDAINNGGIGYEDASDIMSKVAEAMIGVHQSSYMHLDLAPDNIFVDDLGGSNDITIIDFGIAAMKSDTSTFAVTSEQHGHAKAFFGAPEQRLQQASQRSDIFSLGAVGFSLVLGWKKTMEAINKKQNAPYDLDYHVDPRTVPSDAAHLHGVIKKATWPDKGGRFATMQEMADSIAGKEPDTNFPRLIIDARVNRLVGDGPWLMGREDIFGGTQPDIIVKDTAVNVPYISREHAVIERRGDGILILRDMGSTNGTRVKIGEGSKTRWIVVGPNGYPIGNRFQEICLGYADYPPEGAFDESGNPLTPGPYKTIEFEPPSNSDSTP